MSLFFFDQKDEVIILNCSNTDKKTSDWPLDENGNQEKAVFLTHCSCADLEDKILRNMLEGFGIPSVAIYPSDGAFGKVILGISPNGADVYVPASYLSDAQALIGG